MQLNISESQHHTYCYGFGEMCSVHEGVTRTHGLTPDPEANKPQITLQHGGLLSNLSCLRRLNLESSRAKARVTCPVI